MAAYWKYETSTATVHWTRLPGPVAYTGKWLTIHHTPVDTTVLRIPPRYRHDGATLAPDFRVTRTATVLHDAIYQFAEAISANCGWSVRRVLRFGDRIFLERMLRDARRVPVGGTWRQRALGVIARGWDLCVAYVYFAAVRLAGYRFHVLARRILGPAELRTKHRQKNKDVA